MSGQQINCLECAPRWVETMQLGDFEFLHDGTEKRLEKHYDDTGLEVVHCIPGDALRPMVCDFCNAALQPMQACYSVEITSPAIKAQEGWHRQFIIPQGDKLFPHGKLVCTPGANDLLVESMTGPLSLLAKHLTGDFGEVPAEDKRANLESIKEGLRVLSSYLIGTRKIWLITEADRSVTTFLLPDEY